MGKYFGTDGFRGEANRNLTAEHAFRIGRFLGWYLSRDSDTGARVVIGKDTRRSGYMLEYALAAGLTASGADAYLLHVTTTPSVAYVCRTENFSCGIMISASHNPYCDNGIKLFNAVGEKMEEEVLNLAEDYLDGNLKLDGRLWEELPLAMGGKIGRTVDYVAGRNRYVGYLIGLGRYSFKGIRVGLDCANGAAWSIARNVFNALGAQVFAIHTEPDGCNINRDCGSTHMESLRRLVLEKGLDVGFAYDGDADRCLCVDEKGNVVSGEQILYFCGKYMKERGQLSGNRIVTTLMSNPGLPEALEELKIEATVTDVGDRNVSEAMTRLACALGGEPSGHIIFSQYASTGDGILTSLKIMEVMLEEKKSLENLCRGIRMYPQVLKNVPVSDRAAAGRDPDVLRTARQWEQTLGSRGRILLRPSGTEPVLRLLAEGEREADCREALEGIHRVLTEKGYCI